MMVYIGYSTNHPDGFPVPLCQNKVIMQQSTILKLRPGLMLSLLVFVFSDLWASDFDDAMDARVAGEHHEAYRGFKRLAKRDHIEAQYQLGMLYLFGKGVEQDTVQGISWLKQAAENGSYGAANELGQIYLSGKGVAIDEQEAVKWLELATRIAEQNEGEAEDGCD
jgi:TPR repeat protein